MKRTEMNRRNRLGLVVPAVFLFLWAATAWAGPVVGIYGLPAIGQRDAQMRVQSAGKMLSAVFVPADEKTIQYYKKNGKSVFVSVNVFGGKGAWHKYPDSRPVRGDGTLLGSKPGYQGYGGVCPTHEAWRQERLDFIRTLLRENPSIDGIWLDFIRYPGQWEDSNPQIEDTCYCERCLKKFEEFLTVHGNKRTVHGTRYTVHGKKNTVDGTRYTVHGKKNTVDGRRYTVHGKNITATLDQFENPTVKFAWMQFKKEQINAFVRDARKVIDDAAGDRKVLLGLFTVPLRKGDLDNAISFKLAQDMAQLSQWADVISPMVYHRMVVRPAAWVGEFTRYAKSACRCEVWPIVQSVDVLAGELRDALAEAGKAEADGVLVYSYGGMKSTAKWRALKAFKLPENLIKNWTQMGRPSAGKTPDARGQMTLLRQGYGGQADDRGQTTEKPTAKSQELRANTQETSLQIRPSRLLIKDVADFTVRKGVVPRLKKGTAIGIAAGNDRAGEWAVEIPGCDPGAEYVFTGYFYRELWRKREYPYLSFWGQSVEPNTFWLTEQFQPILAYVTCPGRDDSRPAFAINSFHLRQGFGGQDDGQADGSADRQLIQEPRAKNQGLLEGKPANSVPDNKFKFINPIPGETYWLAAPKLIKNPYRRPMPAEKSLPPSVRPTSSGLALPPYFPIGTFGASIDSLETIRSLSLNSVLIGGSPEGVIKTATKAHSIGLNIMIAVPRDPDRLTIFLEQINDLIWKGTTSFYVNDEPGIHSFPVHKAEDIQQIIKARFPWAPTGMAVVRAQACRQYMDSADFFMMDQYPVPYKPLSWLTDSLDIAAANVGRNRLMSIPQAFGSEKWKDVDWPRPPTAEEMAAIAYLSVIHGSRAVFFWTYSEIGKTEDGRKTLGWAAGQLNHLQPWLVVPNADAAPRVDMRSEWCCDSGKKPAVHGCLKYKDGEIMLLTANAIGRWVEAEVEVPGVNKGVWRDDFTGDEYPVIDGNIRVKFDPFQVRPLIIRMD